MLDEEKKTNINNMHKQSYLKINKILKLKGGMSIILTPCHYIKRFKSTC